MQRSERWLRALEGALDAKERCGSAGSRLDASSCLRVLSKIANFGTLSAYHVSQNSVFMRTNCDRKTQITLCTAPHPPREKLRTHRKLSDRRQNHVRRERLAQHGTKRCGVASRTFELPALHHVLRPLYERIRGGLLKCFGY